MKKQVTVVIPAFNEEAGIRHFYEMLAAQLAELSAYTFTMLFVVDGGTDATFALLQSIAGKDDSVRVLKFSRNFGHQTALLAGIDHAEVGALIMMDADMQHPVSLLPRLLAEYENGNDVVYTVREDSGQTGLFKKVYSKLFYALINLISDVPIQSNAADFRLISNRIADLIRTRIRERTLFLRGIMSWVGFKQTAVYFKADERYAGTSKYTFSKNIHLALSGIVSFSRKPLRAATLVGMIVAFLGFIFAAVTVISYFLGEPFVQGWATIVVLLAFFGGIQLFFLGVIGEYVGAIFDEVKARPHYLIETSVNVSPHS